MITEEQKANICEGFANALKCAQALSEMRDKFAQKREIMIGVFRDRTRVETYKRALDIFLQLEEELKKIQKALTIIPSLEDEVSTQYLNFLTNTMLSFNPEQMSYLSTHSRRSMKDFLDKQTTGSIVRGTNDNNVISLLQESVGVYSSYVQNLSNAIYQYRIFEKIKHIHGSIVMVGANGSGKSTLARQLKGKLSDNITILAAQTLLYYHEKESITSAEKKIYQLHSFQSQGKLSSDSNFVSEVSSDMNNLIETLIADHMEYCTSHQSEKIDYGTTNLDKTCSIWHDIIEHRKLKRDGTVLKVSGVNINDYDFNYLSDGEKAVFYYIGHVLLAKNNSYIIVDEPEKHLHASICNKLWDKLEAARQDCKFIYLTHNLNFAVSRADCTFLWNKSFTPPAEWDFMEIPHSDIISERLILELAGSRKNICFVESKNDSGLDVKLYSILFPEFTIVPCSGHMKVVANTRAYNALPSFITKAVGIVDHDFHTEAQIEDWNKDGIYTLPVNEVENILCDEKILKSVIEGTSGDIGQLERYKQGFWDKLKKERENQALTAVIEWANNFMKGHMIQKSKDIESLRKEIEEKLSVDKIEERYQKFLDRIDDYASKKDEFAEAIGLVNFKGGLVNELGNKFIVNQYVDRTLRIIKKNEELREYIKTKYFDGFYGLVDKGICGQS